jgi:uncharacterized membrane protein SirB2
MESLYPAIRDTHIGAVLASGSLFAARALALNIGGARWPLARPVRTAAYSIDTVLLAAALTLVAITGRYPFVESWLTAKVLLLILYIALGWFALRATGRGRRIAFAAAAIALYVFIISIARAHLPLGMFESRRIW